VILVLPAVVNYDRQVRMQTGDIVEYGSYPQTNVTDSDLITALNACTLAPDNTALYSGSKYQRVYFTNTVNTQQAVNGYNKNTVYWFKFEPVRWRVLADNNGDLLLLSDKILATRVYNTPSANITWENSTVRAWLNDSFYNTAFTKSQQARINLSHLVNADNAGSGTPGGNDTDDNVFLLSYNEAVTTAYGFSSGDTTDTKRQAQGSDYAKSQGLQVFDAQGSNSFWWLRSPGFEPTYALAATSLGWVVNSYETTNLNWIGVRPVISANPSKISYAAGDIIEYGSYPQTEVTNPALIETLNAQTPDAGDNVLLGGVKYKRVFFTQYTPYYTNYAPNAANSLQDDNGYFINTAYWFKYEPVRWRVLSSVAGGEMYLMCENILAAKPYNASNSAITWELCSLRSWLNGEFLNTAFTYAQRLKIKTSAVANEDNPRTGTSGGNATNDKLFLLSYSDVVNSSYGFSTGIYADTAREVEGTDYAKSQGLSVYDDGTSFWWLKVPGEEENTAMSVLIDGHVGYFDGGYYYYSVHNTAMGVRPIFKINQDSMILTPVSGSGCVVDYLNGTIYGLTAGIDSLNGYAEVPAGYEAEPIVTSNGFGTGTGINVNSSEANVEVYTIIIYGDVNGDGNIDSTDAGIAVDYENYMIDWDPVEDAAYLLAGDVNGDGNVDSTDAGIMVDYENYMVNINQATGLAS
jgi:hypothetical protein